MTTLAARACLALAVLAACASGARAFCVYNSCSTPITAFQLPISGGSFKKVISSGTSSKPSSECCNWRDCGPESPEAGRCGKAQFCMVKGSVDVGAVTAAAVLGSITDALVQTFNFIPGVGAVGAANEAARQKLKNLGLDCDAVVSSYNGGIVECREGPGGPSFYGAWDGSNATPPPGTSDC